jgi:hypothetical protein
MPAGTWAVAVMGGSAASHNFGQLFIRPAGSQRWKLVTPPGVPDNGGLVLAAAGPSLITGFRPSQYLTYTPLTTTADGGQAWSSTGSLDGALANVPDALAPAPRTGRLLALLADGTARLPAPAYTKWTTLATLLFPRRDRGGQALRAAEPHRRRLHAVVAAAARRGMLPPRNHVHLRRQGSGQVRVRNVTVIPGHQQAIWQFAARPRMSLAEKSCGRHSAPGPLDRRHPELI